MRLEGSLDAFSLPDIFSLLSMTKKSGGLHLRRDGAHGVVWFAEGAITGGASDVSRQALARRFVGTGLVDDATLNAAITAANEEKIGVAKALQGSAALDDSALHELAAEHIVDSVFDLLRWPIGDFEFVIDEPNPDDVGTARSVDEVVEEGRRRLEIWGAVATSIPSPQTILSLTPKPAESLTLTPEEWKLLALVDGRRTVGEIVALCGRGEFAVVSGLADLVNRGLLSADGAVGVSALFARHEALARYERGMAPEREEGRPASAPPADMTPGNEMPVPESTTVEALAELAEIADADIDFSKPTANAMPSAAHRRMDVSPARPEPFLPARQPVHPEDSSPLAVNGGGVVPAAIIDRDPSINKSLLLRLIAGVRGL